FKGSSQRGDYGDVIHEIDWQFEQLMDALVELGLEENTIVVFTSDNGPPVERQRKFDVGLTGPLRDGKWTDFEGGVRVPFIIRWPGKVQTDAKSDAMIGIIDMLPTFCELAGVEVPLDRVIDGVNVLPQLMGDASGQALRDLQIVPGSTIIHDGWKYYFKTQTPYNKKKEQDWGAYKPAEAGTLYNLNDDIGETSDVSSEHPEIAESLKKQMDRFMAELESTSRPAGDASDLEERNFQLEFQEGGAGEPGEPMDSKRKKKKKSKK
ncbi:MAG: sulfatase-like hydrolase/transferase, partial [Coraliomargarita sp.]